MDSLFSRSRSFIYALPLLLITIMVTTAGAQGFAPFAPPGGLFGQGARGQYLPNFGRSEDPGTGLSVLVGYASNAGINVFRFDSPVPGPGGFYWRQYDYDATSALYLGAELPIELGSMGKAFLSGSLTLPATKGLRMYQSTLSPGGEVPTSSCKWDADTIWGTLQGLYGYPAFGCYALAGFRWDHWQTSIKNRTEISPNFVVAAQTDTGALSLNGYIPLVGVSSCLRGLTLGMVGFPWVPGDFEFAECRAGFFNDTGSAKFKKAWFIEFFADYRCPILSLIAMPSSADANLWVFGKFNYMEAKSNFIFTRMPIWVVAVDTDFSFYRAMFVFGAKATLDFNMPNVRGWF